MDGGRDATVVHDLGIPDVRFTTDPVRIDDTGTDATADAGDAGHAMMDGGMDLGFTADAGDAGPPFSATLDGVISPGEWDVAHSATTTTVSAWGATNQLRGLYAVLSADGLWLAIDGQVDSGNAIVVYVDDGEGDGAGVADLSTLSDSTGVLDDAVSAGFTQPATFRADWAFGTASMSHASMTDFDDVLGWRDILSDGADFHWQSGAAAPAVCGATACETLIQRATLGGPAPPRTVALFARITNHDGTLSPNQSLPPDDDTMPRIVSVALTISE